MRNSKIKIENLSVVLGDRKVLSNLSTSFSEGELVSVLGRNGAGKSTLLRSIAGLITQQNGSVTVYDQSIHDMKRKDIAKKISFLPQKLSLVYPVPVRDFILMGRYPYLRPLRGYSKEDRVAVEGIISRLCLEELAGRYLHELSGGEQQRVLLAGALVQEARFVILDEPSAFLDPVQQEILYESLRDVLQNEGIGIIVASHHLSLSRVYSDRIIALAEGEIVFDGNPHELAEPNTIKLIYGKEVAL